MPYIHVSLSHSPDASKVEALRDAIASRMPLIPGKTRNNTMIHIDTGCQITMGDDGAPAAFLEARLFQEAPTESKQAFVKEVTAVLGELTGIPANRVYMNIFELEHWGSGGNYR